MRMFFRAVFPVELLLVIAFVLFCEMALRYAVDLSLISLPRSVKETPLNGYYPPPHVFDGVTGFLYRPNFAGRFVRTDFDTIVVTNNFGFRDTNWTLKKPDNVIRVAVLGDSYLAANQVSIPQQWLSLVEKNLSPYKNQRIELMNFGIDGFFNWNWIHLLDYRLTQFSPDVIILWSQWSMMQKVTYPRYRDVTSDGTIISGYSKESVATLRKEYEKSQLTVSVLLNRYSYLARFLQHALQKVPVAMPNVIQKLPERSQIRQLSNHSPLETILTLNKMCHAQGIGFGVYWRLGDGPPTEKEASVLAGIPSASDLGLFNALKPLSFQHDAHFSPAGNALYAEKTTPVFQYLIAAALANKRP